MKYFQIDFKISPYNSDAAELLAAIVADAGLESFEESKNGLIGYVQESLFDEVVLNQCIENFPFVDITITYTVSNAEDKNWNEQWEQEGFKPIVIADKVLITNIPEDDSSVYDYKIIIKPQQAFGTGTHHTTSMIIRRLCEMNLQGMRVLDAGCGTGILGIFSLLRGAKSVFAYDIDNWSVRNTQQNVALNHLTNLDVEEGNVTILADKGTFDLILANINRNILLADMKYFRKAMHEGSLLIISGFYVEDISMLIDEAESLGLTYVNQMDAENWASLLFRL